MHEAEFPVAHARLTDPGTRKRHLIGYITILRASLPAKKCTLTMMQALFSQRVPQIHVLLAAYQSALLQGPALLSTGHSAMLPAAF